MFPAGALAASVPPSVVAGNPGCSELGITGATELDFGNSSGTATDGTLTVHVTVTSSSSLDFTASTTNGTKVLAVFVKGGSEGGNLYDYRPAGTLGDNDLTTPPTGNGNQDAGISHVVFCYGQPVSSPPPGGGTTQPPGTTTTTPPATTTTTTTTTTTSPTSGVKGVTTTHKKKKKHKKPKKHVKAKSISRPPRVSSGFTG